jgi:hypothetical protein
MREWDRIDITLAPGYLVSVSPQKDQNGRKPLGIEKLFGRRDMFVRTACFTLTREIRKNGTVRFHLNAVAVVGDGSAVEVSAFPSRVVWGGFVLPRDLEVRMSKGNLVVSRKDGVVAIPADSPDLRTAQEWMRHYAAFFELVELDDARTRRLAPPMMPLPSAQVRALWAIDKYGSLAQVELVDRVGEAFGRDNLDVSFRSLLDKWSASFRMDEDEFRIGMTDSGRKYLSAYRVMDRRAVARSMLPTSNESDEPSD